MSVNQISPASVSSGTNGLYAAAGSNAPAPSKNGATGSGQNGDNVSLSTGMLAAGGMGIAAAAAALGVGGTYLLTRGPSESAQNDYQPRRGSGQIATPNRIAGAGIHEHLPYFSPPGTESNAVGDRYHPAQSGANCAVDTYNMLVNGVDAARITVSDYISNLHGVKLEDEHGTGSVVSEHALDGEARKRDGMQVDTRNAVTHPAEFAKIWNMNLKAAEKYASNDPAGLKQLHEIRATAGKLAAHEIAPAHLESSARSPEASALHKALDASKHPVIGLATPIKSNFLGAPQAQHGFKHHYFTIERQGDTWVRRDSSKDGVTKLLIDGKPVASAFDAIRSIMQHERTKLPEHTALDTQKPLHVFVPLRA